MNRHLFQYICSSRFKNNPRIQSPITTSTSSTQTNEITLTLLALQTRSDSIDTVVSVERMTVNESCVFGGRKMQNGQFYCIEQVFISYIIKSITLNQHWKHYKTINVFKRSVTFCWSYKKNSPLNFIWHFVHSQHDHTGRITNM